MPAERDEDAGAPGDAPARAPSPVERYFRLETFARAGFAARGIVYLLLGYFALVTTHGEAATGILDRMRGAPAGSVLLVALALGLFGYGLWRLIGGVLDLDDEGRSLIGIITRIGLVVSGLTHWALAAVAVAVAASGRQPSDQGEEQAARTAFEYPGGAILVGLVGLIIVIGGVGQLLIAARGGYRKFLEDDPPRFAVFAGGAGYAARGAVLMVVGWQVISLAIGWGGRQLGMDSALDVIAQRGWVFPVVAAGLILFGIFSLIVSGHLRIRDEDVERRAKLAARWWRRSAREDNGAR